MINYVDCSRLNKYLVIMIETAVMPKKTAIDCIFIARRRMTASRRLSVAIAIIKANVLLNGIPFLKRTTVIGTIAPQLPFIGMPN